MSSDGTWPKATNLQRVIVAGIFAAVVAEAYFGIFHPGGLSEARNVVAAFGVTLGLVVALATLLNERKIDLLAGLSILLCIISPTVGASQLEGAFYPDKTRAVSGNQLAKVENVPWLWIWVIGTVMAVVFVMIKTTTGTPQAWLQATWRDVKGSLRRCRQRRHVGISRDRYDQLLAEFESRQAVEEEVERRMAAPWFVPMPEEVVKRLTDAHDDDHAAAIATVVAAVTKCVP